MISTHVPRHDPVDTRISAWTEVLLDTTTKTDPVNSNVPPNTPADQTTKIADFLTIQSLTYSTAMLVIGVIWEFAQSQIKDAWAKGPLIPGVLAAGLMLAALAYSWSDLTGAGKRLAAVIIATFNALLILAGAFGFTALTP